MLGSVSFERFAAHPVAVAACGRAPTVAAMPPRPPIHLVVGGALCALFFVDQRLPIGDRDLLIVRMYFAEGQEAMAIAAVVDKGGLQ